MDNPRLEFRTIQADPKDIDRVLPQNRSRLKSIPWRPLSQGEQTMFAGEKLVSRSELSMVIAICGVLFFLAFTSVSPLAWSVPAMTLFFTNRRRFSLRRLFWR